MERTPPQRRIFVLRGWGISVSRSGELVSVVEPHRPDRPPRYGQPADHSEALRPAQLLQTCVVGASRRELGRSVSLLPSCEVGIDDEFDEFVGDGLAGEAALKEERTHKKRMGLDELLGCLPEDFRHEVPYVRV